jgi:pimeloyl-ACP methyl ester carboxylesterase
MRWMTEDPINCQYCGSDPVNWVDLWGLETWIIHGTFSSPERFSQEFEEAVSAQLNDTTTRFEWSGGNTRTARTEAAKVLVKEIVAYTEENPDGPINLVGHSHGGNVAIKASNMLADEGIKVDNLITMGTPVRGDYQLSGKNFGSHTNIYNPYDATQSIGGGAINIPGIGETGPSGRTYKNANNIKYSYVGMTYYPTKGIFGPDPVAFFTDNHSVYYQNPDCYNTWLPEVGNQQPDTYALKECS